MACVAVTMLRTSVDGAWDVPSEAVPGRGGRVERRAAGKTGRVRFVSIHTRPTVARDLPPEVYRAVRDARKALVMTVMTSTGKGLNCRVKPLPKCLWQAALPTSQQIRP